MGSPLRRSSSGGGGDASVPLLEGRRGSRTWGVFIKAVLRVFLHQVKLAVPLAINLVAANAAAVVNLLFVSRGGTQQLAAAALGNNVAVMLGRLVLMGLCGALDTLAAQAWGAGKEGRLPLLLQRTVVFLWAHCAAISAAMLLLPDALGAMGQDPGLTAMVRRYLIALLPSVWLEALSRPITRVLVARGTATPQMVIALVGLPLNVATNYALVVVAGWQYIGAAAAMSLAAVYDLALLLLYVACTGQWGAVIGTPNARAFKSWTNLAVLAYPAAAMKCAESWAFTIMTLAASLLPDACTATAAVGVSYNVYGVLFIAFVACSTAACVSVGNRLGAGDPRGATVAAVASVLVVPLAWGAAAAALLLPASQAAIISLFTDGGGGEVDPEQQERLRAVLRQMLVIVAGLVLLDGVQTVLSGVIQGCGRQRWGALVNGVAFYVFAVPLALQLAFGQGLGAVGLYLGMAAGPAIQTVCYAVILFRTDWDGACASAQYLAAQQSTSSLSGLMRRFDPGALAGAQAVRATSIGSPAALPWLPIIQEGRLEGHDTGSSSDGSLAAMVGGGGGGGGGWGGGGGGDSAGGCGSGCATPLGRSPGGLGLPCAYGLPALRGGCPVVLGASPGTTAATTMAATSGAAVGAMAAAVAAAQDWSVGRRGSGSLGSPLGARAAQQQQQQQPWLVQSVSSPARSTRPGGDVGAGSGAPAPPPQGTGLPAARPIISPFAYVCTTTRPPPAPAAPCPVPPAATAAVTLAPAAPTLVEGPFGGGGAATRPGACEGAHGVAASSDSTERRMAEAEALLARGSPPPPGVMLAATLEPGSGGRSSRAGPFAASMLCRTSVSSSPAAASTPSHDWSPPLGPQQGSLLGPKPAATASAAAAAAGCGAAAAKRTAPGDAPGAAAHAVPGSPGGRGWWWWQRFHWTRPPSDFGRSLPAAAASADPRVAAGDPSGAAVHAHALAGGTAAVAAAALHGAPLQLPGVLLDPHHGGVPPGAAPVPHLAPHPGGPGAAAERGGVLCAGAIAAAVPAEHAYGVPERRAPAAGSAVVTLAPGCANGGAAAAKAAAYGAGAAVAGVKAPSAQRSDPSGPTSPTASSPHGSSSRDSSARAGRKHAPEVFRSCESLAAACPSSCDYYSFDLDDDPELVSGAAALQSPVGVPPSSERPNHQQHQQSPVRQQASNRK